MAKSKKSKILAMALCASVMTGIYAAPVMAAAITVSDTSILEVGGSDGNKYTITSGTLNLDGDNIAAALNGTNLTLDSVTANSVTANTISTTGNARVGGTLEVTGDTTLAGLKAGATTVDGTLEVTGDTTLAGLTAGATTVDSLKAMLKLAVL